MNAINQGIITATTKETLLKAEAEQGQAKLALQANTEAMATAATGCTSSPMSG